MFYKAHPLGQLGLDNYSIDEICKDEDSKAIYELLFEKFINGLNIHALIQRTTFEGQLNIRDDENSNFAQLLLFRLFNLKKISLWCNKPLGESIPLIKTHGTGMGSHTTKFMIQKINYEEFKKLFATDDSLTITEFIKI